MSRTPAPLATSPGRHKVVELYADEALWAAVQRAAQDHVRRQYSSDMMRRRLAEALGTTHGARTP